MYFEIEAKAWSNVCLKKCFYFYASVFLVHFVEDWSFRTTEFSFTNLSLRCTHRNCYYFCPLSKKVFHKSVYTNGFKKVDKGENSNKIIKYPRSLKTFAFNYNDCGLYFYISVLLVLIVLIDRSIALGWKNMFVTSKEQQIPPHDSTLLISNYLTHRVFMSQIFMDVWQQGERWYRFAIWGCKRTENRGEDISDLSHTWFRPGYSGSSPVL